WRRGWRRRRGPLVVVLLGGEHDLGGHWRSTPRRPATPGSPRTHTARRRVGGSASGNAFGKEGITVNCVAPALIETEMVTSNPRARPDLIPVGRFGAPEEVADVVVLLAGNGDVTGQTVNVNGGWFMS